MVQKPDSFHYERVKTLLRAGEFPVIPVPIILKSGEHIIDATPYAVARTEIDGKKTLGMFFLDTQKKAFKIGINQVEGLEVVEGDGEYAGKMLISFRYFKPVSAEEQFLEPQARKILVYEIRHGVNDAHYGFGEGYAFYLVGQDTQYTIAPAAQRTRQFPEWRTGMMGDSASLKPQFDRPLSSSEDSL